MKTGRAVAAACVAAGLFLGGCQDSDEDALSVVVTLPEHYVAGAAKATVVVDYSGTGARILSQDGGVACAFILPGIDGDFADDRKGTLTIHTNGGRALRGPADIAACHMKASDAETTASDVHAKLLVKVAAAEDSAGKAIDIAAKGSRGHAGGGSGGGAMTESAVEEAQQAAVKAAASSVPPPAPGSAPGASDGGNGVSSGALSKTPPAAATTAASMAAAAAQKQSAARAAAPGILQNPAAAGRATDVPPGNEGVGGTPDRDPSYDDSPSDDDKAPAYTLEFFVKSAGNFGALQLEITHLGNSGGFIGRQDKVDCVSLVEAIVASNYVGERVTKVGLISLTGIRTPAAIMRCGFRTREPLSPNSFAIDVSDASDTDSVALDPFPAVVISTIMPR